MQVKSIAECAGERIAECSLGAFCNTLDQHYAIIGLDKTNNFLHFVEWPPKTGFTVYNKV